MTERVTRLLHSSALPFADDTGGAKVVLSRMSLRELPITKRLPSYQGSFQSFIWSLRKPRKLFERRFSEFSDFFCEAFKTDPLFFFFLQKFSSNFLPPNFYYI